MLEQNLFEDLLKSLRVRRGKAWTQAKVAQAVGVSQRTYVRWENGEILPSAQDLKNIVVILNLDERETDALFHAAAQGAPQIQNLPFAPNPFFTGRASLLTHLEQLFHGNERIVITQPISVSGLGGIGKTQLALEYAHRCYPNVYRSVLWVNAADKASLEASYLSLAYLLQLPEKDEEKVDRIVQAVKIWLDEHTRWLLILDNADDLELAQAFLPAKPRGHILLTTRSQIVGHMAALVQVEAMSPAEGLLLLLRRSGILRSGCEPETLAADIRSAATELVETLAGHPLAIDQAGAYIEEAGDIALTPTAAPLVEYIRLYQQHRRMFLSRRGEHSAGHPESVALTFEISFQKACALHPSCADILSFCSLLHPDAIPEELLGEQMALKLAPAVFNEAMRALRKYSLIKRDREKMVLSLHRLVQVMITDGMQEMQTASRWTACAVQALNEAFPEVTFDAWDRCERYLPHVLACATWIESEAITTQQAWSLLHKTGSYLRERGQYSLAEPLLQRAVSICKQCVGAKHLNTAQCFNDLAALYYEQGRYTEAEALYERVLAIREVQLGSGHLNTASCLNALATLYEEQGRYAEAEALYERVLAIREEQLGPTHLDTADSLNCLAMFYYEQGRYSAAEPLSLRALAIREEQLGGSHPATATALNNLALLYESQGSYSAAEPLYERALAIWAEQLGESHPDTAKGLNNLAELYKLQGRYSAAESLHVRALAIREEHLGAKHPLTAATLNNLALLYGCQGRYDEAESLHERALAIWEEQLGESHTNTAIGLGNLAKNYILQRKYAQAEPLLQRALSIFEQQFGVSHPHTAKCLSILADLYEQQGKDQT